MDLDQEILKDVSGAGNSGLSLYKWVSEHLGEAIKKLHELQRAGVMLDTSHPKYRYYERLKQAIDSASKSK